MHGEHVVYRDSLKPKLCPRFILGGSGITVKWLGWQGNWRVLISCKNHEHQLCWHGTESREKTWMSLKWWACPTLSNMFMSFFNVLNHTKIETFAGKKWLHVACDNKDIEWADDVAETRNEKIKATEKVNLVLIFLSCACATSEFQFHCSNLPQLCALVAFHILNKGCHCNCGPHQKQFKFCQSWNFNLDWKCQPQTENDGNSKERFVQWPLSWSSFVPESCKFPQQCHMGMVVPTCWFQFVFFLGRVLV